MNDVRRRSLGAALLALAPALAPALPLSLAAATAGCKSGSTSESGHDWGDGEWTEASLTAASDRVLWQVTLLSLEKAGFAPGTEMDPVELVARSTWNLSLAPFKGDGFREQAIVRYVRLGEGRYDMAVRVRRERNDAMDNPLDAARAKWVEEPDNVERARIVLQFVRSFLGEEPIEVAPRPSQKHGIRPDSR